jgi:hypothetical protein
MEAMMLLNQKTTRTSLCLAVALAWSGAAQAQGNPEAGDVASPQGNQSQFGGQASAGGQVNSQGVTTTTSTSTTSTGAVVSPGDPAAPPGDDAHSTVVGHFGVGFFGVTTLPLMGPCGGATCSADDFGNTVAAPSIGARYWLSDLLGIEGAVGLHINSATTANVDTSASGFAIHGGVPLALAHSGYFAFEVVPQLDFGYAWGSIQAMGGPETTTSGLLFQLGAKVGGEIHFGFVDLPQLALQGTLGLMVRHENRSVDLPGPGGTTTSIKQNATDLATGVDGPPWAIFLGTISAIYYFGV